MSTNWIKDGEKVVASRHGTTLTGVIIDSRVRYGGKVSYTVSLDTPVKFPWRNEMTYTVIVGQDEIVSE